MRRSALKSDVGRVAESPLGVCRQEISQVHNFDADSCPFDPNRFWTVKKGTDLYATFL